MLGFCKQRDLPTTESRLVQRIGVDPRTGMVGQIGIDIQVPPGFPEKYHEALVRAASQCAVKKHLEHPPAFDVKTVVAVGHVVGRALGLLNLERLCQPRQPLRLQCWIQVGRFSRTGPSGRGVF